LLAFVTVVFVVSTALAGTHPWLSWVQATAIAAMVGGLADWFAVTALFRRPLGLPIPHTAIVVERKDRFADTLGNFVQESFLSPQAVNDRLHSSHALERSTTWLADPGHARLVAGRLLDVAATAADLVASDDVQRLFDDLVRDRLDRVPVAPAAGRLVAAMLHDGRHETLIDAGLESLSRYLARHGTELHVRLGRRSPWWIPGPLEARVVHRLIDRSRAVLSEMAEDRGHPLRKQIDEGLHSLAVDLQESPELRRRTQALASELLTHPHVRRVALGVWEDGKASLRAQLDDPASPLRERVAGLVVQGAAKLRDDPELVAATERAVEVAVTTTLARFDSELASLVSGTIDRWDAVETSRRLELLLGPDLQFIRINGTVVGGLAGLALHGVAQLVS
jgi:uncharacterized membrane-anchored protein YjiN (DUF445 family)